MARTKTVFRDPYHVWASQSYGITPYGRNGSHNRSFQSNIAYSYREPIAYAGTRKGGDYKGEQFVLLRDYQFSTTSSKHFSEVHSATRHYTRRFTVHNVGGQSSWEQGYNHYKEKGAIRSDSINHKANLAHYKAKIVKQFAVMLKARESLSRRIRQLAALIEEGNEYSRFFGYKTLFSWPSSGPSRADLEAKAGSYKARSIAREAARGEKRRELQAAHLREFLAGNMAVILSDLRWEARETAEVIAEHSRRNEAGILAFLADPAKNHPPHATDNDPRVKAKRAEINAEIIERWKAGATDEHSPYGAPDMLRIKPGTSDVVETGRYVEVPLGHVKRALRLVLPMLASGRTIDNAAAMALPIRLGHYALRSIDAAGNVAVGCHTFAREELERFGRILDAIADWSEVDTSTDNVEAATAQ